MNPALTTEIDGDVLIARMDDGKANVLGHEMLGGLQAALDAADADKKVRAVVIAGRPGCFSGGFDLAVMRAGQDATQGLVRAGAELCLRLYGFRLPVVGGCTGHAIAAGAITLMSLDTRIGAEGKFKIGMSEVALGMRLPVFAASLAQDRLSRPYLTSAAIQGELFSPGDAVKAGYLDRVVDAEQAVDAAIAEAHRLAKLPTGAHALTKELIRSRTIDHIRKTLDTDISSLPGLPPA